MNKLSFPIIIAALLATSSCVSLGNSEAPPAFLVLTAQNSVKTNSINSSRAADAIVVLIPDVPRQLDTNRIPVQISDSSIAYIKDAFWSDKPARLMQELIAETITAQSGRLVLDDSQSSGLAQNKISGTLSRFGLDESGLYAIVRYDGIKLNSGGMIEKRRFEARRDISLIDAEQAGIALNEAANEVAIAIATWVK